VLDQLMSTCYLVTNPHANCSCWRLDLHEAMKCRISTKLRVLIATERRHVHVYSCVMNKVIIKLNEDLSNSY
jgi:hypothetical protein